MPYLEAFQVLNNRRPGGMGGGAEPIPVAEIEFYARAFWPLDARRFVLMMYELDVAFREHAAEVEERRQRENNAGR